MKTADRQNNFNLVRLVLALLVIFGHSPELVDGDRHREVLTRVFGTLSFGELAVDGFFALSGYLILQSWESAPHAWLFLKKRMLRIYPGFLAASLVCAFVVGPLGADAGAYFSAFDLADFLSACVFLQLPAMPPVFQGHPYAFVNGAMWTISREFACYCLVLAAGVAGLLRLRHFCLAVTALLLAAMACMKLANVPVMDLRLLSFFLCGACYYTYRGRIAFKSTPAIACAVLCLAGLCSWRGAELVLAAFGTYALLTIAAKRSPMLSQFNRLPDVSYGIYLYGWPIQKLLLWFVPALSPWTLFALAAPAAALAGALSWYLIEKPALRWKGPSIRLQELAPHDAASGGARLS